MHSTAITLWKQHPGILLLDYTYKINPFSIALLNICAVTGGNIVVQIRLAFIRQQRELDCN
jgi:hypothetical protein